MQAAFLRAKSAWRAAAPHMVEGKTKMRQKGLCRRGLVCEDETNLCDWRRGVLPFGSIRSGVRCRVGRSQGKICDPDDGRRAGAVRAECGRGASTCISDKNYDDAADKVVYYYRPDASGYTWTFGQMLIGKKITDDWFI